MDFDIVLFGIDVCFIYGYIDVGFYCQYYVGFQFVLGIIYFVVFNIVYVYVQLMIGVMYIEWFVSFVFD